MIIDEDRQINYPNLKGVVVDPGHGGVDPGASGNGIIEKNYTLLISEYMANRFRELGIPVTLTRTTDETLTPEERVSRILNAYGNDPNVIVISNHLNAGGGEGAEAIYALRNKDSLSRIILEEIAKEGQDIRKWYQRRLPSDTSKDYYFIHRNTGVTEPVIVEYGFIDNSEDALDIKNNWRNYTEAVVRGVAIYKGIPYGAIPTEGNYIVQSGDTLWSIAKKFNVGVQEIKDLNNLTTSLLSIGQQLQIPGYVPPSLSDTTYVVQKGDTLWEIANAYKTTVNDIMVLNNLTTTSLEIGQIIKIPKTVLEPEPTPYETYTVQIGDSLWSIANRYNTTVSELKRINNITSDILSVGQTLLVPTTELVPAPEPIGNTYTVQIGDNLWSIARKFGVTVDEIRRLNNLQTDILSINQVLLIPVTEPVPEPEPIPPTETIYTVKSGDSLWIIANQFGTTVDAIKEVNNLITNNLSIGQQLIIPTSGTPSAQTTTYTVEKGDSLYSIANMYGTTPEELIILNNLSNSLLSIGQTLLVPVQATTPTRTYIVKSGDSLWTIANQFGITVDAIKEANNLITNNLSIGQVLQIP